jgi:hypothetical protein
MIERGICVDQKAHDALSGGKWVKRLLLGKLADESERRSNIINSQIVLALNFFKGHPPGEAPNHDRHWNTRATNDGFPVADSRVDNDTVLSLHVDSNITGFAQLVEISVCEGRRMRLGSSAFGLDATSRIGRLCCDRQGRFVIELNEGSSVLPDNPLQ